MWHLARTILDATAKVIKSIFVLFKLGETVCSWNRYDRILNYTLNVLLRLGAVEDATTVLSSWKANVKRWGPATGLKMTKNVVEMIAALDRMDHNKVEETVHQGDLLADAVITVNILRSPTL